jgi:hypothetical protein
MRISWFTFCLVVTFSGCVQDSASGSDSDGDDAGSDAGSAGGQMNGDCPNHEWWCVEGPDAGMVAITDGGPKPDAKEGEDKQFNGWIGTETKFIFTRYAGETQTCALSYRMQDLAMVDECAACDLAYTATLSAVDVTVDDGGCGDAASREGEVLFFGHGTMTISLGLNVLYEKIEANWRPVDGGFSALKNDVWIFYIGVDDELQTPPNGMMQTGLHILGEVDTSVGLGTYIIRSVDNDGQTACELSYPVTRTEANETCAQCTVAYDLSLGNVETVISGSDCALFDALSGLTQSYGHTDPNALYINKDGQWNAFGFSEMDGDVWRFTMDL